MSNQAKSLVYFAAYMLWVFLGYLPALFMADRNAPGKTIAWLILWIIVFVFLGIKNDQYRDA